MALLVALYALEGSAILLALALYKKGDRPLSAFLRSRAGVVLLLAFLFVLASVGIIAQQYWKSWRLGSRRFHLTIILNLIPVVTLSLAGELIIRGFSVQGPNAPVFVGTTLLPRSWDEVVARNRAILKEAAARGSYLVSDDVLGWTIGPNRRSSNGLYFSSAEGIRSPRPNMTFADVRPRYRIAVVGDSFTFGLEVRYEDSWPYLLQTKLGPAFQVLNFGVDGYGVDQAYLRYYRDVRPWHPDIVILGFIDHDLERTMSVYSFLLFRDSKLPFAKPRFVLKERRLTVLNVPVPSPVTIFEKSSIGELPFLEYDRAVDRTEWERHSYHRSYLVRFLVSRFPRWPLLGPEVSDETMMSVNGAVLGSFIQEATKAGSMPILAFFPSRSRLENPSARFADGKSVGQRLLEREGSTPVDLTPCVSSVKSSDRFVILHYSAITNAAVARCFWEVILRQRPGA